MSETVLLIAVCPALVVCISGLITRNQARTKYVAGAMAGVGLFGQLWWLPLDLFCAGMAYLWTRGAIERVEARGRERERQRLEALAAQRRLAAATTPASRSWWRSTLRVLGPALVIIWIGAGTVSLIDSLATRFGTSEPATGTNAASSVAIPLAVAAPAAVTEALATRKRPGSTSPPASPGAAGKVSSAPLADRRHCLALHDNAAIAACASGK